MSDYRLGNVAGVHNGFPQPLQANIGTAPQIISQSLRPKLFPIHCSLITPSFYVIQYALLKASLNGKPTQYNELGLWQYERVIT